MTARTKRQLSLSGHRVLHPLSLALLLLAAFLPPSFAAEDNTIYDPDPHHLWNRLNESLFVRNARGGERFGLDELDILYWRTTTHLLSGSSHHKALAVLDEFINTHGERLVRDPLKRAWFQRDLWELFDWATEAAEESDEIGASQALQSRLAVVLRRVALTTNEISSLPDNYSQSACENLPRSLFETNGDWLLVHDQNDSLTTPTHVSSFGGHSAFTVHLRVSGGHSAGRDYLHGLRSFARTNHLWVYQTNNFSRFMTNEPAEVLELNPAIPQFPTNTDWALVRRMLLIDTAGNIRATPFVESIQVRHYLSLAPPRYVTVTNADGHRAPVQVPQQRFYEFQFDRRDGGRLREIGQHERGFTFVHFMGKGIDLFDVDSKSESGRQPGPPNRLQSGVLDTCTQCHTGPGIFSVNSYTRSLSFSMSSQRPANLYEDETDRDTNEAIFWKQRQFDWGLLRGLWMERR
jgi:hypothetical protein